MKYCPQCGTQNMDDYSFCEKCGNPFPTDNAEAQPQESQPAPPAPQPAAPAQQAFTPPASPTRPAFTPPSSPLAKHNAKAAQPQATGAYAKSQTSTVPAPTAKEVQSSSAWLLLALGCWAVVLLFCLVNFRFNYGFSFNFLEGGLLFSAIKTICAAILIAATVFLAGDDRANMIAAPLGLVWFVNFLFFNFILMPVLYRYPFGMVLHYYWPQIIFLVIAAVAIGVFFVSSGAGLSSNTAFMISIAGAVIWFVLIIVLQGLVVYQFSITGALLLPFASASLQQLAFLIGIGFLGLHTARN